MVEKSDKYYATRYLWYYIDSDTRLYIKSFFFFIIIMLYCTSIISLVNILHA